jgi:hypothetical protein
MKEMKEYYPMRLGPFPYWLAALALLLLVVGCAYIPQPKTPAQTTYAAYGLYVVVGEATADLLLNNMITAKQAEDVMEARQEVRPVIARAKEHAVNGWPIGDRLLDQVLAANRMLLDLQQYLDKEGVI